MLRSRLPPPPPLSHGRGGPVSVSDVYIDNISRAFVESCVASGLPLNQDFNGPERVGAGPYQFLIRATLFSHPRHTPHHALHTHLLATFHLFSPSPLSTTHPHSPSPSHLLKLSLTPVHLHTFHRNPTPSHNSHTLPMQEQRTIQKT